MDKIQFHFRTHTFRVDAEQELLLERLFGAARILRNRLLNIHKTMKNGGSYTYEACLAEVNDLVKSGIFEGIPEDLVQSTIVTFMSEWEDYQEKRVRDLTFVNCLGKQTLWLLSRYAVKLTKTSFQIQGFDTVFTIPEPIEEYSDLVTAFLIERERPGRYRFSALYETPCHIPHCSQDPATTGFGKTMVKLITEIRLIDAAYFHEHAAQLSEIRVAHVQSLMRYRKIVLHRLLRKRIEQGKRHEQKAA